MMKCQLKVKTIFLKEFIRAFSKIMLLEDILLAEKGQLIGE